MVSDHITISTHMTLGLRLVPILFRDLLGDVGGRLLSEEVLSGLVMVATKVTRACTVEAVILMGSDVEEEGEMVVGGEAVEEFSSFCGVAPPPC